MTPQQIPPDETAPQLVKRVEPQYPQMAAIAHIQGYVLIDITITETGGVANARAIYGHPILAQAALDAVRQWEYSPLLKDGKPSTVETTVKVEFRMPGSPDQEKTYEQIAERFNATMERCRKEWNDLQLGEAQATCKQAVAISGGLDPQRRLERAEAFKLTGHVLCLLRKFPEALENYRKELEFTLAEKSEGAELAEAHWDVGNGLWKTGFLDEAAAEYEKAEAVYLEAADRIDSEYLKNEYAKRIKIMLSHHASLLRRMGNFPAADALDRQSAAITVKIVLKE
jgi:TonB family protein